MTISACAPLDDVFRVRFSGVPRKDPDVAALESLCEFEELFWATGCELDLRFFSSRRWLHRSALVCWRSAVVTNCWS